MTDPILDVQWFVISLVEHRSIEQARSVVHEHNLTRFGYGPPPGWMIS